MMEHLRFAVCIVLPGATSSDVVKAAITHTVHIIDKEPFDPSRDYNNFPQAETLENGARIFPLFVLPDDSVLVDDRTSMKDALTTIHKYKQGALHE
jgi:hypothetical protein